MKRVFVWMMMLALLCTGSALADLRVQLPMDSRCTLTLPEGMVYDGPGEEDEAAFAWVSTVYGLEADFICADGSGIRYLEDMIPELEAQGMEYIETVQINGIDMMVCCYTPDDPADMPCIAYIFRDGSQIQMIEFWYADQAGADMTRTIMESIE